MTDIRFDRLLELPPRDAWRDEARDFTPWLAANIAHLSEAVGMPLELSGIEVAVDQFSADILARNPMDGSVVLIENQLERTDHNHLGQIMTYLAGLKAQTVIWIAPQFREPHLSAIRWLNEHTVDEFSFFAVKLRVVRIGNSPFAPIFEVVEKPSSYERQLDEKRRQVSGREAHSDTRLGFWKRYCERFPDAITNGIKETRGWNCYSNVSATPVVVSVWIGDPQCGIFVRGPRGEAKYAAAELLAAHAGVLAARLGANLSEGHPHGHVLGQELQRSYTDPANWDGIIDWLEEHRRAYIAAIGEVVEQGPSPAET